MADPRKAVSFEGIGEVIATYAIDNSTIVYDKTKANGSAQVGLAVTLSADGTVKLAEDAEAIEGKLLSVQGDNFASVQVGGFMTLPGGSGATLTRGTKIVGDLGAASAKGYIRSAASGQAAELLVGRGRIVESGTATAVVVHL